MFALSSEDLRSRILGCADGPASFNAEATAAGFSVISAVLMGADVADGYEQPRAFRYRCKSKAWPMRSACSTPSRKTAALCRCVAARKDVLGRAFRDGRR